MSRPSDDVGDHAVRVWTCPLDASSDELDRLAATVTPSEADRASRFRSREHRDAAVVAAAFVRGVLASHLAVAPLELRFTSACRWCGHPTHGKPRLLAPGRRPSLDFSLSHAGGLAVLAISSGQVGVDVEPRPQLDALGARRVALTADERRRLGHGREADDATLRLWTQKEAYLKGIGKGLVHDPARVSFEAPEAGWAPVLDDGTASGWRVCDVDVGTDWMASLAVEGAPRVVEVRSWPVTSRC